MRKPLLVSVFLLKGLLSLHTCAGQDHERRDRHGNLQFDPDGPNTTRDCWIPPYQNPNDFIRPRQGLCGSNDNNSMMKLEDISPEDLHALAVEYAPVIFFHPLEKYTLSSVDYTLSQTGRIWNTNGERYVVDNTLNMTVMLQTTRDAIWSLNANKFYFETDIAYEMYNSPTDALYGDGYDSEGRSKATVYYNVYEAGNNTWALNFFLYYPYNGEGNLGVLGTYEGVESFTRFTLKPYGVHEGDWENVAVLICAPSKVTASRHEVEMQDYYVDWEDAAAEEDMRQVGNLSLRKPVGIHYRQHSWTEIKDCTRGECTFFKDTHHPVGFAAFNSHATYPQSVSELIYQNIDVGFFFSLQSFVVVDRTVYKREDGSYNYFFPTVDNMERLLNPYALRVYPPGLSNLFEPYYWQGFGGLWGNSEGAKVDPEPPLCLNLNQTGYVDCPTRQEDQVFDLAMQFMAVYPTTTKFMSVVQSVTRQLANVFAEMGKGPEGPVAKGYFQRWTPPKKAPLWNGITNTSMTAEYFCDTRLVIADTYRETIEAAYLDIWWEILVAVIMAGVLTGINIFVPVAATLCRRDELPYQPITFDKSGVPNEPNKIRHGHLHYSVGAITYTFFFFCMTAAGLVFLSGSGNLFSVLTNWVPWIDWEIPETVLQYLCLAIILANTFLLVFLWLQVFEMRNMIQGTYYKVMGDSTRSFDFRAKDRYVAWSPHLVDCLFRCCFGLLFLSLLASMICVMVGMATVGFAFAAVHACNTVTGAFDSYCVDLTFLGMDKVACGDDFRSLCTDWASVDGRRLFWSSFAAFICHFYLVGSCGYAMQQRRAIPAILAQYKKPAPGEVVNGVLKTDSFDKENPKKPEPDTLVRESSNVRFSLPRKNRPESPIICQPMSPITTKTLIAGESPWFSAISNWSSSNVSSDEDN